jgi:hypothetical protein
LRNVKFVLSPPGHGLDCFRTWEALALGCIPIVLNTQVKAVYDGVPVLIVNKWEDVTDALLIDFERRMILDADGVVRTKVIYANYWRRKMFMEGELERYKMMHDAKTL